MKYGSKFHKLSNLLFTGEKMEKNKDRVLAYRLAKVINSEETTTIAGGAQENGAAINLWPTVIMTGREPDVSVDHH